MAEEIEPKEQLEIYQRKFRNLESDRKAYAEETVALIKKQRGIIDKINTENGQLKDIISKMNTQKVASSSNANPCDTAMDDIKDQIERERQKEMEYKKHIAEFQKKIGEKRGQGMGNTPSENESGLSKQIKILENRLDKANQKFNEAIALNKQLRQTIDSLRRERVIFDNLYKKLEKELHEKRKLMANIIETANTAYEERDRANDTIQNLKQQAKKESQDFEKDLRELSHTMEKNKKSLEYIKQSEKTRVETKNTQEIVERQQEKQKILFKDRTTNEVLQQKRLKYEEDFAKIQAATKIIDFDQLVLIFLENEEKNFRDFKQVNEQSNEIEDYEKQLAELNEEIKQYSGPGTALDLENKKKLQELETKLQQIEVKTDQYDFKFHESEKLIGSLTNWIETLFNTIECDKGVANEMAGGHGVTDANMMIFLGIIEEKVNVIVQSYSKLKQDKFEDEYKQMIQNPSFGKDFYSMKQRSEMPPDTDQDDQADGEAKLLTREEFKKKAIEKIDQKRQIPNNKSKHKGNTKTKKK